MGWEWRLTPTYRDFPVAAIRMKLFRNVARRPEEGRQEDPKKLVFVGSHNGDHPFSNGGVGSIWRMKVEGFIVIVDFEEYLDVVESEAASVVLLVWIIGVTEVVKHSDGLD
jgi:hypothetical protein